MVRRDVIKEKEKTFYSKWYPRTAALLTLASIILTLAVGWTGLIILIYAAFVFLVGIGKQQQNQNYMEINKRRN